MNDPTRWSLREAGVRLARREIRARALTQAYLARIAEHDGALNAFVTVTAQRALAAADAADARETRLGPLDGVPIALKDNIDLRDTPTSNGLGPAGVVHPSASAPVVERLLAAGAVVLGKLNLHEAALGATSDNPHHGAVHNPWRHGYTPGGSSGGSGAAVAARLCAAALGTDTMGSVRLPAAYCGVSGLKPTGGLVSTRGVAPLCRRLDQVGAIARSVGDLALLLEIMAAHDPGHAASRPAPPGTCFSPAPPVSLDGLVIGVIPAFDRAAASDVGAACQHALELAARHGARMVDVDLAGYDASRARRAGLLVCEAEGAASFTRALAEHPSALSPSLREMLAYGRDARPERIDAAWREATDQGKALRAALAGVDVIACPSAPQCAFPFSVAPPASQADFTALASFAGCPALSLPCATGSEGLPVGLQLITPEFTDGRLLGIALAFEALLGFDLPDLPGAAAR